jgi:hypothetical protein
MRIAEGFSLMNIVDSNVVVPLGERNLSFKGMITLNDSGAFLWKKLEEENTKEGLLQAMLEEYDIDEVTAEKDIEKFVNILITAGVLE